MKVDVGPVRLNSMQETTDPSCQILLTVIVPVFNEAATLGELLHRVLAAPYSKQVIVIDDGSTDGTAKVLEGWADHPGVEVLRHTHNRGKGRAIRTALPRAVGLFTIIQDADLEYAPSDFPRLIEPLVKAEGTIVYGSRYIDPVARASAPLSSRIGVAVLNTLTGILYNVQLTDEATCYKAFPTALLRAMDLKCERFEFCPEVTAKASRLGIEITEVGISYRPRTRRHGKKIRWRDGLEAVQTLWRWRRWRPMIFWTP